MDVRCSLAHDEVQDALERVVDTLNDIDPDDIDRDEWESDLGPFMDAVSEFVATEPKLYAAVLEETSARDRIRKYLLQNKGEPVTTERLKRVGGVQQYGRRLRELRNQEGFVIDSTRTRADLDHDEYVLVEVRDVTEKHRPSSTQRMRVLERDEFTCQKCGGSPQDDGSPVQYVEVDHKEPFVDEDGDGDLPDDAYWTLCDRCHTGKTVQDGVTNRRGRESSSADTSGSSDPTPSTDDSHRSRVDEQEERADAHRTLDEFE